MEIILSNGSDKPIYEQICLQIKSMIMEGTLSAGEALPSMRALAKDLHISVITVQRAYEDLTRDGFIETVSGKGSFVASQNMDFMRGWPGFLKCFTKNEPEDGTQMVSTCRKRRRCGKIISEV